MGSLGRTDGWTPRRARGVWTMMGRVGSMMMGASLSRVRTRYVYTSVDLGLVHFRARERASELDAMTTMRRRSRGPVVTDGWMDERDEGGLSIHLSIVPSFDRSFDG